jgi:hypothetical protein
LREHLVGEGAGMTPQRTEPSVTAGERAMLEGRLDYHRETLALKCAGLDDDRLRNASVPPSELSLMGLVRHMAEVERSLSLACGASQHHSVTRPLRSVIRRG